MRTYIVNWKQGSADNPRDFPLRPEVSGAIRLAVGDAELAIRVAKDFIARGYSNSISEQYQEFFITHVSMIDEGGTTVE